MKKLTSQEKSTIAQALIERIKSAHNAGQTVRFMEVCGTHTVSIFREGLRQLLPQGIELLSGPGCPVCVTDQAYIDKALAYSEREDVIIATFGDMLKIPGSQSSLNEAKSKGRSVHIVYTPMEIIQLARQNKDKKIIFLAIGFETTIAIIAATVKAVYDLQLKNVFFLVSHKLIPPALKVLTENKKTQIDGFLLPGHVSVIIGEEPYAFLPRNYNMPCAIAGFDGLEILNAIASLMEQHAKGVAKIDNVRRSVVAKKGNKVAQQLIEDLYDIVDEPWRGIGKIEKSGLRLKAPYNRLDIEVVLPIDIDDSSISMKGCQCGSVLQGFIQPDDCPLFGKACTPDHPIGACMVSIEGSCAAWFKYGLSSGGLSWME